MTAGATAFPSPDPSISTRGVPQLPPAMQLLRDEGRDHVVDLLAEDANTAETLTVYRYALPALPASARCVCFSPGRPQPAVCTCSTSR